MTPHEVAVSIAKKYIGLEEEDGNRGLMIDHWNRLSGVPLGSPWCASFMMFCVEGAANQMSMAHKLYRSAHVLSIYNNSKACWARDPQVGFLVVWQMGESLKGHIGIITEVLESRLVKVCEGNTAKEKSINREGRVVAEQVRNLAAVGKMKFKGFLDPWRGVPSNSIEIG